MPCLPGLPEAMRPVPVAQIQWLLEEAGPQFVGNDNVRKRRLRPNRSFQHRGFGCDSDLENAGASERLTCPAAARYPSHAVADVVGN